MHVQFRNLRIQDLGRSTWVPANKDLTGDFTLRLEWRGKESGSLFFGDISLSPRGDFAMSGNKTAAPAEPQKGVKPISSGEWHQLALSFHKGRLVVHVDGVRVQDRQNVASVGALRGYVFLDVRREEVLSRGKL